MRAGAALEPGLIPATSLPAQVVPFGGRSAGSTIIVKGSWRIGPAGALDPLDEAIPIEPLDRCAGEPGQCSVRYESDLAPHKPKADLLCVGSAWANRGKPGPGCVVSFGVGNWLKQIQVIGNRAWKASMGGHWNSPTEPQPFVSMPVTWENAFGGRDPADPEKRRIFAQNPIGKGYASNETALGGLSLPNLEDPAKRMTGPKDQPPPRCFGPVGRTWQPRLKLAGTYDRRWTEPGGAPPPVPDDFNEAFYNCAPADQQIAGYLRGDEKVRLVNMHAVHADLTFVLPKLRVRCLADRQREGRRQLEDLPTNLDTLWVDTEAMTLVLVWRARLLAGASAGVAWLVVVSEPLGSAPAPPEAYRHHVEAFEAEEAGPADPEIEPADVAPGVPDPQGVND